jgi:hypothetical protein
MPEPSAWRKGLRSLRPDFAAASERGHRFDVILATVKAGNAQEAKRTASLVYTLGQRRMLDPRVCGADQSYHGALGWTTPEGQECGWVLGDSEGVRRFVQLGETAATYLPAEHALTGGEQLLGDWLWFLRAGMGQIPMRAGWDCWAEDRMPTVCYFKLRPDPFLASAQVIDWATEEASLDGVAGRTGNAAPRLEFDVYSLVITLDGKDYAVNEPKAFAIYKALADAMPQVRTKRDIAGIVKGVGGDKTIPRLLAKLPDALHKTVKQTTAGYSLRLPRGKDRK